jgi:hypothetical protein
MAKLYAELSSDKGGRIASKSGDDYITIQVSNGNARVFEITFKDDGYKRGMLEIMSYATGTDGIQTIGYCEI